jgi:hypothetical protein
LCAARLVAHSALRDAVRILRLPRACCSPPRTLLRIAQQQRRALRVLRQHLA